MMTKDRNLVQKHSWGKYNAGSHKDETDYDRKKLKKQLKDELKNEKGERDAPLSFCQLKLNNI